MNQLEPIEQNDLKAMELKYLGNSYAEIAEAVGVEYSTVKSWFMRSGRLYRAYLEYSIAEAKERRYSASRLHTRLLDKAVSTMGDLLDSHDERIRFVAAKEVINRELTDIEPLSQEEVKEAGIMESMEAIRRMRIQLKLGEKDSLFPKPTTLQQS